MTAIITSTAQTRRCPPIFSGRKKDASRHGFTRAATHFIHGAIVSKAAGLTEIGERKAARRVLCTECDPKLSGRWRWWKAYPRQRFPLGCCWAFAGSEASCRQQGRPAYVRRRGKPLTNMTRFDNQEKRSNARAL